MSSKISNLSISEKKELIQWAIKNKVKSIKDENFSFEISDLAFIDELNSEKLTENKEDLNLSNKTLVDTEKIDSNEEEDLLFWSTNK